MASRPLATPLGRPVFDSQAWPGRAVIALSFVALSWLVSPTSWGLAAITLLIAGIADLARRCAALAWIHPSDGAFRFHAVAGTIVFGLSIRSAPIVSVFFREPQLATLLPVAGFTLLVRALAATSWTKLAATEPRQARWASLAASLAGAYFALVCAALGEGPFALLNGALFASVLELAWGWWKARPTLNSPLTFTSPDSAFTGDEALRLATRFAAAHSDRVLVGAALGAPALGLYYAASELAAAPMTWYADRLLRRPVPAANRSTILALLIRRVLSRALPMALILALTGLALSRAFWFENPWRALGPVLAAFAALAVAAPLRYLSERLLEPAQPEKSLQLRLATTSGGLLIIASALPFGLAWAAAACTAANTAGACIGLALLRRQLQQTRFFASVPGSDVSRDLAPEASRGPGYPAGARS